MENKDIPDARKSELKQEVTFSWLKAVASLANFKGGYLWIGVADSAGKKGNSLSGEDITGVEEDFISCEIAVEDRDKFQQLKTNIVCYITNRHIPSYLHC